MGIDIAGATIATNVNSGITFNSSLYFDSIGRGATNVAAGYSGWKASGVHYYSSATGWEINGAQWSNNINLSAANGVFTCPVAGYYAMGYNAIQRGGTHNPINDVHTFSYAGFAKNGALAYFVHWNTTVTNSWNTGGTSALFSCAAGDTLALFVNWPPAPAGPDAVVWDYGIYPDLHQCVWCKLVG